jgi:hypothetical protein
MFFGHHRDCAARQIARYKIKYQKAKDEMELAERILQSLETQTANNPNARKTTKDR